MTIEPNGYDYEMQANDLTFRIVLERDGDGYTAYIGDEEEGTFETPLEAAFALARTQPGAEVDVVLRAVQLKLKNLNWYVRSPVLLGYLP